MPRSPEPPHMFARRGRKGQAVLPGVPWKRGERSIPDPVCDRWSIRPRRNPPSWQLGRFFFWTPKRRMFSLLPTLPPGWSVDVTWIWCHHDVELAWLRELDRVPRCSQRPRWWCWSADDPRGHGRCLRRSKGLHLGSLEDLQRSEKTLRG